jgi:hypothetical protein
VADIGATTSFQPGGHRVDTGGVIVYGVDAGLIVPCGRSARPSP